MEYLSVAKTAEKWGLSERSVRNYCAHGRIADAKLIGKTWYVPKDAKKPSARTKRTAHRRFCRSCGSRRLQR